MCVITCDHDDWNDEDGRYSNNISHLADGQYVPIAPASFYVPGLRAIFQTQAERATWFATAGDLGRTCALPDTYWAAQLSSGAQRAQRAIFRKRAPRLRLRDAVGMTARFWHRHLSRCPRSTHQRRTVLIAVRESTQTTRAGKECHKTLQQSNQSPVGAANTSPPESRCSQGNLFPGRCTQHRRRKDETRGGMSTVDLCVFKY